MDHNAKDLVELLKKQEHRFSDSYRRAFKKYFKWQAYIERVICESRSNPDIISMALTHKLIAYIGVIDSLKLSGDNNSRNNVAHFFELLDEHERFLLMMAIKIGKTRIVEELPLEDEQEKEEEVISGKKQREEMIIDAYLRSHCEDFNGLFKKTVSSLYSLRSVLVHEGAFISVVINSDGSILASYSPNWTLMIDESVMSLSEMFLRGFCKIVNINAPPLKPRAKEFLQQRHYAAKTPEYLQLFESKFS